MSVSVQDRLPSIPTDLPDDVRPLLTAIKRQVDSEAITIREGEPEWSSKDIRIQAIKQFPFSTMLFSDSGYHLEDNSRLQKLVNLNPLPNDATLEFGRRRMLVHYRSRSDADMLVDRGFDQVSIPGSKILGIIPRNLTYIELYNSYFLTVQVLYPADPEVLRRFHTDPSRMLSFRYGLEIDRKGNVRLETEDLDYPHYPNSLFFTGSNSSGPSNAESIRWFLWLLDKLALL